MLVSGSKIEQEDYRAVLGVYKRRVEALRLFVLLSLATETCGIEETFFLPPPLSPAHRLLFSLFTSLCGRLFSLRRGSFCRPTFDLVFVIQLRYKLIQLKLPQPDLFIVPDSAKSFVA